MAKVTVEGINKTDIANALGIHTPKADFTVAFRVRPEAQFYTQRLPLLPGLVVKMPWKECADREFTTLEEAIQYIRKIYKEAHNDSK